MSKKGKFQKKTNVIDKNKKQSIILYVGILIVVLVIIFSFVLNRDHSSGSQVRKGGNPCDNECSMHSESGRCHCHGRCTTAGCQCHDSH